MHTILTLLRIDKSLTATATASLLGLGMVVALLDAFGVALIFPIIAMVQDPATAPGGRYFTQIASTFGFSPANSILLLLCLVVPALIAKSAVQALYYRYQSKLAARAQEQLANRLVSGYLTSRYEAHLGRHSADLTRNIVTLVRGSFGQSLNAFLALGADALAVLALILLLFVLAPGPSLAAGALVIVILVLQQRLFRALFQRLGSESAALCARELIALQKGLGAIKESQVTGRSGFFVQEFTAIQAEMRGNVEVFDFVRRLPPIVTELAMIVAMAAGIAALSRSDSHTLLPQLAVIAAAAFRLIPMANRILASINMLAHGSAGLALIAEEQSRLDGLAEPSAPAGVIRLRQEMELRNVAFAYPGSHAKALHDVNLTIRAGESLGLVGRSGAGKSTLADIVLGLFSPTQGAVLIDGEVVDGFGRSKRIAVGYVPQRVSVFDESVRRNVAFGVPEAEIDQARVLEALDDAQLSAVVESLPHGIESRLGENGQRLSGGQLQRIGIARALYDRPAMLVLDEATSALDASTEAEVGAALRALKGRVTMIIIAHRLGTLRDCDRLAFVEMGTVADVGTYGELLERNPGFRQLVEASGFGGEMRD